MDRRGNLCAGVSSGGVLFKTPGRIGQVSVHLKIKTSSFYSFTVVCLVAWPLNESEAVGDLNMTETSLLLS